MLLRHHESTRELEIKHLECIHRQRDDHLKKQHLTERSNQQNYNSKAEQDLRKKHALEQKQQPRSLRVGIFIVESYAEKMGTKCIFKND